jgi:hypothetical protein
MTHRESNVTDYGSDFGPRVSGAGRRAYQQRPPAQAASIYAEGGDEDLLQEGRRNIRDFFQREDISTRTESGFAGSTNQGSRHQL